MTEEELETEEYEGFIIVFTKENEKVWAGFPKNKFIACAPDQQEAFSKIKGFIHKFPSAVRMAYKNTGKSCGD